MRNGPGLIAHDVEAEVTRPLTNEKDLANLLWQVNGACLVSRRRERWCGLRTPSRLEVSR